MDGSTHPQNPYLAGNYAPVRSEDDFALTVTGEIPRGLNGALYRNGPNPQFEPRGNYHWFGGDGMIHGFFLEDGGARYRNRWVRTPRWTEEHAAGRALFGSMGAPSDPSVAGHDAGTANTNIVHHAGRLLALAANDPFEIDPTTLEPKGYLATGGRFTAHPKMDPETREMVWFAYSAGPAPLNNQLDYGVTDAAGKIVRRDRFTAPYSSMVHDFMVTRNHVLFPILPVTGDMGRAMTGGPAFAWEPDKGAFVGVMHRQASVDTIRWFELPPCYVFHPMNAWEEGSLIHAEVMEYARAPSLFRNADGSANSGAPAVLVRWTFDLAAPTNAVKRTVLDDMPGEFPRFDERRAGLAYRHGWFASLAGDKPTLGSFDSLSHIDLATGRRTTLTMAAGDNIGEPIFVAGRPDAAEGDGWLLAPVYRGAEDRSDLVILNAQDILAGPVATLHLPRRVPFGFHGNWVGA